VATKLYGLAGPIPLKIVIDHKGIIRYTHVGDYPPGEDELPFVLEDLVKEMGRGNDAASLPLLAVCSSRIASPAFSEERSIGVGQPVPEFSLAG